MSILIDTHIFLWAAGLEGRLTDEAKKILNDPDVPKFFSAASAWEIAIKWSKKRLTLPAPPEVFVENVVSAAGFSKLAVTFREAYAVANLPHHHKNPFDRLLVAQAKMNSLRLMTVDNKLKPYDIDLIVCKKKKK